MRPHTTGFGPFSAPARIALAVFATFAALLAVLFAARPDMVMGVIHMVMGTR